MGWELGDTAQVLDSGCKTWKTLSLQRKTEAHSLVSLPTGAFEPWTFPHFGNFSGKFISCLSAPVKSMTELLQNRRLGWENVRNHPLWWSQLASLRALCLRNLVYKLPSWTVTFSQQKGHSDCSCARWLGNGHTHHILWHTEEYLLDWGRAVGARMSEFCIYQSLRCNLRGHTW